MKDLREEGLPDNEQNDDNEPVEDNFTTESNLRLTSSIVYKILTEGPRPDSCIHEESVNETASKLIESYRGKDAVKFTFLPKKYGVKHSSVCARKEAQLLQMLGSTDVYLLDPDFMDKCHDKFLDERQTCEEQEETHRAQEWARKYCVWQRLFGEAVNRGKIYRCRPTPEVKAYPYTNKKTPKPFDERLIDNLNALVKKMRETGFNYETKVEDKLNNIHDVKELYNTALSLIVDGPDFPNLTLMKTGSCLKTEESKRHTTQKKSESETSASCFNSTFSLKSREEEVRKQKSLQEDGKESQCCQTFLSKFLK